jgi:hypothetical protein
MLWWEVRRNGYFGKVKNWYFSSRCRRKTKDSLKISFFYFDLVLWKERWIVSVWFAFLWCFENSNSSSVLSRATP